ncbi:PA14 domain-containing protein [Spirosoma rhododendri]|uniref:T9SS type A sorting domain-containing protein n=1 Tax=Spirosoma rhododendri TaxID=2728024 RepID=A0A7L5DSA9_9BACT|nr:PA14 domain-containing protein [Spirosoma rhododendri]QJD80133.1 T9SS type A sorting domain-containing protein [Spirosoma rhododendri]
MNGTTVVRYSVSSQGRLSGVEQPLGGLVAPVSVAVSPVDGTVAVLEGGTRQQLRGYRGSDGASQWVRGVAGGYLTDPVVSDEKFYVTDGLGVSDGVFVSYGADGSVWVGDGGNYRVQHYGAGSGSGGPGGLVDRIQYQPHSYSSQVVGGSGARRVLGEYLEYGIDYSRSAVDGWQLVRNWRGSIPAAYFNERSLNYLFITDVFKAVTTLSNGRTYALLKQPSTNRWAVVELPSSGPVRFTGLFLPDMPYYIAPDGSLNQTISFPSGVGGTIRWQKRPLTGFDSQHNPIWGDAVTTARIPTISPLDPVDFTGFGGMRPGLSTTNGTIVSFNKGKLSSDGSNGYGFHLGGIRPGASQWTWRTAPATSKEYTGDYPTDGAYDIGNNVEYGGGDVTVSGRHIFWNYHGEFWKNSQTNKWHHVYEDGLVVGNFGITGPEAAQLAPDRSPVPGMAGNVFYGTAAAGPDGAIYIYHAEEAGHGGIHRWRVDGLETIREQFIPVTVSESSQQGLSSTYMTGADLNNANAYYTRIDTVPVLPAASTGVQARAQQGVSSVRWQGFVVPPGAGPYTFYVTADKGVRLWVDNTLLIDQPGASQSTTHQQLITLDAGTRYPIRLESFGGTQLTLSWSAPNLARQPISSKYLIPAVDPNTLPGLNLLDGLSAGTSLVNGLYGWQRSPAQEDLTDYNNKYWSLRTNVKTYDRFQATDLNIRFRQAKAVHTVTRSLGDSTKANEGWRLTGVINQEDSFFNIDEGRNKAGGVYFDVLDDAGRLLVRFNNQVTLKGSPTGRLFINNKLIAQGDYNYALTPVVHRNQPIDISVSNGQVTIKYGPYPPVTAPLADEGGNWRKPRQIRLYFWGDGYNVNRVMNLQNLRFFADLGTTQINLLADDERDQLAATLSAGAATILVSTDGGPFVPYTTPIQVGDVERPAGYWRFQLATTSAAAGQIVYSPAFTTRPENPHLTLSPNPTSEWLTIGHPSVVGDCTIRLYAADGRLVQQWTPTTGTATTTADVHNLPPGVYVVRFEQNEQRLSARLVVNSI